MNRLFHILLFLILISVISCTKRNLPTVNQPVDIHWGIAIRTIEAKVDTLGGESGICIGNEALTYTIDTATAKQLTQQRFTIRDYQSDGPAVWVKQDSLFSRIPVTCGNSNGKKTIITSGLNGGEELVTSIQISPNK